MFGLESGSLETFGMTVLSRANGRSSMEVFRETCGRSYAVDLSAVAGGSANWNPRGGLKRGGGSRD